MESDEFVQGLNFSSIPHGPWIITLDFVSEDQHGFITGLRRGNGANFPNRYTLGPTVLADVCHGAGWLNSDEEAGEACISNFVGAICWP